MADGEKQRAWQKEHTVVITMRLQMSTDSDILAYFEGKSKQALIKKALREYMENHKEE